MNYSAIELPSIWTNQILRASGRTRYYEHLDEPDATNKTLPRVTMDNTKLIGAVISGSMDDWNTRFADLDGDVEDADERSDSDMIFDTAYESVWGVALTLENGAIWQVDPQAQESSEVYGYTYTTTNALDGSGLSADGYNIVSNLTSLEIGEDCQVILSEGMILVDNATGETYEGTIEAMSFPAGVTIYA